MLIAKQLRSHKLVSLDVATWPDWLQSSSTYRDGERLAFDGYFANIGDWIMCAADKLYVMGDEAYHQCYAEPELTLREYGRRASATANTDYDGIRSRCTIDTLSILHAKLTVLRNAALEIEKIKKHLIYGKKYQSNTGCHLELNDDRIVQALAWLKYNGNVQVMHGILGLGGEAGETATLLSEYLFEDKAVDDVELLKELGDPLWYVNQASCGRFEQVGVMNNEKLASRYPAGFDPNLAINHNGG